MKKGYGRKIAWLLCAVMFINQLSTVAAEETVKQQTVTRFNDIKGHWAEEILTKWEQNGWIEGLPDGSFSPDKVITRAEFVTLMNRLFTPVGMYEGEDKFSDVMEEDWFYKDVMVAMARGYVSGFEDGSFKPNAKIVRQDVAVMISKCLNLEESSNEKGSGFKDEQTISSYAKKYVEQLSELKIITGDEQGRFNPKKETTRAEAVVLLDRAYAYYESLVASGVINEQEEKEKTSEEQQGQNSDNEKRKEEINATTEEKKQTEEKDKQGKNDNSKSENGASSNSDVLISEKELEELLASDVDELDTIYIGFGFSDDEQCVTQDLTLPSKTEKGTNINWSSNNTSMISNNGKVTRPSGTSVNVTLTATITTKEGTRSKQFPLKVIRKSNGEIPHDNSYEEIVEINGEEPKIYTVDENGIPTFIYAKVTDIDVQCPEDAIRALNSVKTLMHMENPEDEFKWKDTQHNDNMTYYRLQQFYKGIEINGHQIIVATTNNVVSAINGHYLDNNEVLVKENNVSISNDELEKIVCQYYNGKIIMGESKVVITQKDDAEYVYCYKCRVDGRSADGNLVSGYVYIGAERNVVSEETDVTNVLGKEYQSVYTDEKAIVYDYSVKDFGNELFGLVDKKRNIVLGVYKGPNSVAFTQANKNAWNDSAIMSYAKICMIYDYYKKLGVKDYGSRIEVIVDEEQLQYEDTNGSYTRIVDEMNYNQIVHRISLSKKIGDEVDLLQKSLDMLAHEYAHGIVFSYGSFEAYKKNSQTIKRGDEYTSIKRTNDVLPAINEAYADILGELVEKWIQQDNGIINNAWSMGENSVQGKGHDKLRSLANPHDTTAKQWGANHINEYNIVCEEHARATILGHAAYLIWTYGKEKKMSQWEIKEYAQLWMDSIFYLDDYDNFQDVANQVLAKAFDQRLDQNKYSWIIRGFAEVGLKPSEKSDSINRYWYKDYVKKAEELNIVYRIFGEAEDEKYLGLVTEEEFLHMICLTYGLQYDSQEVKEIKRVCFYNVYSTELIITTQRASQYIVEAIYQAYQRDNTVKVDRKLLEAIVSKKKSGKIDYMQLLRDENVLFGVSDRYEMQADTQIYRGLAYAMLVRTRSDGRR